MIALKLRMDGTEIERPHRVKHDNRDIKTKIPRTTVLKLLRFKDKTKIF